MTALRSRWLLPALLLGALAAPAGAQTAPTQAAPGTLIDNTAAFEGAGHLSTSNTVSQIVREACGVSVTPLSTTRRVSPGERLTHDFVVTNLGNAAFDLALTRQVSGAQWDGELPATLRLAAGEARVVSLSLVAGATDAQATLDASCAPALRSASLPGQAQGRLELLVGNTWVPLVLGLGVEPTTSTDAGVDTDPAQPGPMIDNQAPLSLARYELRVRNAAGVPARVTVTDQLDAQVRFVGATLQPDSLTDAQSGTLRFTLELAAGEERVIYVVAQLPDSDDVSIDHRFTAQADASVDPAAEVVTSPVARARLWSPNLALQKIADQLTVAVGTTVGYTITATNASRDANLTEVRLTDTLPRGLALVDGTLMLGGQPATDLDPDPQVIAVVIPDLQAGRSMQLTYRVAVTPAAAEASDLVNVVIGEGAQPGRPGTGIRLSRATIRVLQSGWSDVVGRVYIDADGDGRYGQGDRPVPGARLLLSGGASVTTDALGRFHFPKLIPGRYGVSLDPASLNHLPRTGLGDFQMPGSLMLDVRGLSAAEFGLRPAQAQGSALRTATVGAALQQSGQTLGRAELRVAAWPTLERGVSELRLSLRPGTGGAGLGYRATLTLPAGLEPLSLPAGVSRQGQTLVFAGVMGESPANWTLRFAALPGALPLDAELTLNRP